MKKSLSDDPIERFLTEGTLQSAKEVIPLGKAAITPLLRHVLRAERSSASMCEGRWAAALLNFLPLDSRVIDVMWRLVWNYDVERIFLNSPRWYCGIAGPQVITSLLDLTSDSSAGNLHRTHAIDILIAVGYQYPELRHDITRTFEQALEDIDSGDVAGIIVDWCMRFRVSNIISRLAQEHPDGFEDSDWFDAETCREWMTKKNLYGRSPSELYVPILKKAFPTRRQKRYKAVPDEDTLIQEAVEICARERPESLMVADAFATFRMDYSSSARVLNPSLVERFLLEYWPEFVVVETEEEKNIFSKLDQFIQILARVMGIGAIAKSRLSRRIRECRIGFRHMAGDHRMFSRSKRIVIEAREKKIDWTNRLAVIEWWFNDGFRYQEYNWPEWGLGHDWRLGDIYLPSDVPVREFGAKEA